MISPTYGQQYPEQILFSILQNGSCIGYGGLVHICWEDKRAEISFLNELGLNRLHLGIYDIRDKHIQTIERSGFIREGRLKQHVMINGKSKDLLIDWMVNADF